MKAKIKLDDWNIDIEVNHKEIKATSKMLDSFARVLYYYCKIDELENKSKRRK